MIVPWVKIFIMLPYLIYTCSKSTLEKLISTTTVATASVIVRLSGDKGSGFPILAIAKYVARPLSCYSNVA